MPLRGRGRRRWSRWFGAVPLWLIAVARLGLSVLNMSETRNDGYITMNGTGWDVGYRYWARHGAFTTMAGQDDTCVIVWYSCRCMGM